MVQEYSVHPFPTLAYPLVANLRAYRLFPGLGDRFVIPGKWYPERGQRVDWSAAAFLLVRRIAFNAVGGFDGRQWLYAEDIDLCWRLRRAGWITWYEPRATVTHAAGAAVVKAFGETREERWLRSHYAWMLRRVGPFRTRACAAVNLTTFAARAALLAAPAALSPERYGARYAFYRDWTRRNLTGFEPAERLREHR